MIDDERTEYLERRVAFLETALARLLALVLHGEDEKAGKTKAKVRAHELGSREVLRRSLDAALIDLSERAELTATERMAMPDPRYLRGAGDTDPDAGD